MKKREDLLELLRSEKEWDVMVIGGGATGLGAALDAATRGFKTLLVEQSDFAKSTSSRSTKLVHGGVRYLQQGDVFLVIEALRERGRMLRNCPHLVKDMRFILGNYRWWEMPFYTIGLVCYDLLAGRLGFGRSRPLSKKAVLAEIPGLKRGRLRGGVVYHDGQFDDARMAVTLAMTASDKGAACLNYTRVCGLVKNAEGKIVGAKIRNELGKDVFDVRAKSVINATGIFMDEVMRMDDSGASPKVRPSQGVHLVVDSEFLGGDSALMIPKTMDGRVLFGVPWHGKAVLGTTDTPIDSHSLEPRALKEEVDFILDQAGQYLERKPARADVLSVFAGLRPLAAGNANDAGKTKEISRSHKIYVSNSGLISITGGKWTTYRAMAEECVDRAVKLAGLPQRACITQDMRLHGWKEDVDRSDWSYVYGADVDEIEKLIEENPELSEKLHPNYAFKKAHVVWAARMELAQTLEDVLARRLRALFLDARASIEMAPVTAGLLATELGKDEDWKDAQIEEFTRLAKGYILEN